MGQWDASGSQWDGSTGRIFGKIVLPAASSIDTAFLKQDVLATFLSTEGIGVGGLLHEHFCKVYEVVRHALALEFATTLRIGIILST